MLLWSLLSLRGNCRFPPSGWFCLVERGREKRRHREAGTRGRGHDNEEERENCCSNLLPCIIVSRIDRTPLTYWYSPTLISHLRASFCSLSSSSSFSRVRVKRFALSGFHPRFFHRIASAREIRFRLRLVAAAAAKLNLQHIFKVDGTSHLLQNAKYKTRRRCAGCCAGTYRYLDIFYTAKK